jgi:2',3'-cyclic-nucleotide 2'-phosphodiesterase
MKTLFIGEIVGKAGVFCVKTLLPRIIQEYRINFVIADGEGATGGFGIGKNHAIYLHKLGIDVITGGERIYYKKDIVEHIDKANYLLRPANYPPKSPGRGWAVYQKEDSNIAVLVLLGQSGFDRVHLRNPFSYLPELVERIKEKTATIIVDFHAATTAEKYTMFYHADGLVSAVIGTHSRVMTADEAIQPGGTAVICDAGRTGSLNSVGGLDPKIEIEKFLTKIPERSKEAWDNLELQGVIVDINDQGKAEHIERLRMPCPEVPHDRESNSTTHQ